jgi:exodeoxyribonuclease VII large subunit
VAVRHEVGTLARVVARHRDRFVQACRLYQTLKDTSSPQAILARGYALVRDAEGRMVRSAADVAAGDALSIQLGTGEIGATVTSGSELSAPKPAPPKSTAKPAPRPDPAKAGQGSLF